jgi:hypothetical protein
MLFDNRAFRRICGLEKEVVTGGIRKLRIEEFTAA